MRVLVLITALCALVVAGCGGGTDSAMAPPPQTETTPQAEASSRVPAPAIAGETLDGETLSLADFRGTPVFVNVWSSW